MFAGGRFSRKKREKEKAQEAMAWEVTKMIINSVKREVSSASSVIASVPEIAEPTTVGEGPSETSVTTKL